jgi:hypothetical protein
MRSGDAHVRRSASRKRRARQPGRLWLRPFRYLSRNLRQTTNDAIDRALGLRALLELAAEEDDESVLVRELTRELRVAVDAMSFEERVEFSRR